MKWEEIEFELVHKIPIKNGIYKTPSFHGRGERIINMKELFAFEFISDQEMRRVELEVREKDSFLVEDGDLLFGRRSLVESGSGKCSIVRNPSEETTFESSLIRVRLNQELVSPLFYYYFFKSPVGRGRVLSLSSGTNVKGIRGSDLKKLEVIKPPLPIQRKIASILSAYDDLIENNLKRIKLSEEKAFLSYKLIVKNEKLEKQNLNQVTNYLKRGISPKYVEDDGVVVINQKCIRNHILSFEEARLTDPEKNIQEDRMLQKFDTLINSTGTGTLGRLAMNIQNEFGLTVDSHITIVRANETVSSIFLFHSLLAQEKVIENMGEGSTNQIELSPKKLGEGINIALPSRTVMIEFENQARTIFALIWNLQKQNIKLREARDILLPRLMSGEIEL